MRVLYVTNMWPDDRRPWIREFRPFAGALAGTLGIELDVLYVPGYVSNWEYLRGAVRVLARNLQVYDVVHAHYGHSAILARMNLRAPLVVSYCGDDLLGHPIRRVPHARHRAASGWPSRSPKSRGWRTQRSRSPRRWSADCLAPAGRHRGLCAGEVLWLHKAFQASRADSIPVARLFGHGEWRSLVAHPAGGRAVAGSNPVSPTIEGSCSRVHETAKYAAN